MNDVHTGHRRVRTGDVGQLGDGVTADRCLRVDLVRVCDLRNGTLTVRGGSEQNLMSGVDQLIA